MSTVQYKNAIRYYYRYYLDGILVGISHKLSNEVLAECIGFNIEKLGLYDFELFECALTELGDKWYAIVDENAFPGDHYRICIQKAPAWIPHDDR